MTRITKPKRGGRPTKRLDLTDIRHLLRDQRQWTALGVVVKPEDGGEHWEIVGGGAGVDVMVEVELQPTQEIVTARLAAGMWIVPDVGDEVAVILPAGALDFMPIVTCILSHALPAEQGPAPRRIVIARGPGTEVLIHDGNGGAEPLVKKSEFDGHKHAAPTLVGASYGVGTDPAAQTGGAAPVIGTTVLKAK